jgi:nucleotide-binding universal stress UspA family protein
MYRTILVPLDGSPLAEAALPVATDLAQRTGAQLSLVHVIVRATTTPVFVEGLPVVDEQLHSLSKLHAQAYLEQIRDRLSATANLQVTVQLLDPYAPAEQEQTAPALLATYATTINADLIVMMSHGRGGLARFWLGSVADALVRLNPAPILLLRAHDDTQKPKTEPVQRIIIPLDGSARSESILPYALVLGQTLGARYTLIHVNVPTLPSQVPPFITPTVLDTEQTERERTNAQRYLEMIAQGIRATGALVETQLLVTDQVAAAILDESRRDGYSLIAMSTTGRSGLRRLLLGSIADKVLRRAEVPMLIHRDTEKGV